MWWECSSRPGAAAKPGVSCRVQSSKRRWQRAEEQRKGQNISDQEKSKPTECVKVAYIQDLLLTPHERNCWELKPTICAAENDAHSKRIDMQRHNYHGAGHKNKGEFKQRYRSAVSGPRFTTLTLKASSSHKPEEEDGEEDEPEPSEPLYSLPIIPSLRSCTVFSRGTSKLIHPYTSLKYEPLTSHTQSP